MNDFYGKYEIPVIESFHIATSRRTPPTTACVLLYGDYSDLAERCLEPLLLLPDDSIELRIGMNAVGERTRNYVRTFVDRNYQRLTIREYSAASNLGKYRMMRSMLTDVQSQYVMWFDDDSYLLRPTMDWLAQLSTVMNAADMCGKVMYCKAEGGQRLWISMQPWYRGKPLLRSTTNKALYIPQFIVGGWWTIRTKVLQILQWPPDNIKHRGGDVMLGEALRQNDYKLAEFTQDVAINADAAGNSHYATRRGMSPLSAGIDYEPTLTVILHDATKAIEPKLLDYPGL